MFRLFAAWLTGWLAAEVIVSGYNVHGRAAFTIELAFLVAAGIAAGLTERGGHPS
jgi:hypothetical protein